MNPEGQRSAPGLAIWAVYGFLYHVLILLDSILLNIANNITRDMRRFRLWIFQTHRSVYSCTMHGYGHFFRDTLGACSRAKGASWGR